ncbi:alpha/beta hydrolase [Sulfitobacter sp. D35]|uniref:alpha/beta hydrolase n=1 Tax=Sulfitobacter sp. D35 TaxID=3083252 RepID=UPI00296EB65D|nr:alpha/beta hydrolase [Sulfitobacter sp. D35]MDW4499725.1 alpha/beta hydrolase [Sulfitobacter sp. D35]
MRKRAVILVPSLERLERFGARERLVHAMTRYASGFRVEPIEIDQSTGKDACGLVATDRETLEAIEMHVYEAFWGDLVPDWSKESPWARFRRGLHLIWYWAAGGVARAIVRLEFPARTVMAMLVASLLLLLWYFTVISVLVQAIGTADSTVPTAIEEALASFGWTEPLVRWFDELQSLPLLLFLIMLFGLGRLENISNISSFIKDYLRDQQINKTEIGVRAKTRARLVELLDHVHGMDPGYDEVHVVGHSLGGAIAVDALAGYGKPLPKTTLHTWGAGLGLLVQQDAWVERRVGALYACPSRLADWRDVVFRSDVMASPRPLPHKYRGRKRLSDKYDEIYTPTITPQVQKRAPFNYFSTHEAYYRCTDAARLLVDVRPPAPLEIAPLDALPHDESTEPPEETAPENRPEVTRLPVSR